MSTTLERPTISAITPPSALARESALQRSRFRAGWTRRGRVLRREIDKKRGTTQRSWAEELYGGGPETIGERLWADHERYEAEVLALSDAEIVRRAHLHPVAHDWLLPICDGCQRAQMLPGAAEESRRQHGAALCRECQREASRG